MKKLLMGLPTEEQILTAVAEMHDNRNFTDETRALANIVSHTLQGSPEALEHISQFESKKGNMMATKGAAFTGGFMAGYLCAMGWKEDS